MHSLLPDQSVPSWGAKKILGILNGGYILIKSLESIIYSYYALKNLKFINIFGPCFLYL